MPVVLGHHIAQLTHALTSAGPTPVALPACCNPLGHLPSHCVQLTGPRFVGIRVRKDRVLGPGVATELVPETPRLALHHLAELSCCGEPTGHR
jgi:hypothetical protein